MLQVEYDFTQLDPSDPFPSEYGFGILREDTGVYSILEEPSPASYFQVVKPADIAMGLFNYDEDVVGSQTDYHGLVWSPNSLAGNDATVAVQFIDPLSEFDLALDEFILEIVLGFRGVDQISRWIGGRLDFLWTKVGGWIEKWRLSTVEFDSTGLNQVETFSKDVPFYSLNELILEVVGTETTVIFNGVEKISGSNDFKGEGSLIAWVKALKIQGASKVPFPIVTKLYASSLQSGLVYPIKEVPSHAYPPPQSEAHFYRVPVNELIVDKKLKQVGPDIWEFTEDTTVSINGTVEFAVTKGAVIVAHQTIDHNHDFQLCKVRYE